MKRITLTTTLAALLVLPAVCQAGFRAGAGRVGDEKAMEIVTTYVEKFTDTGATVTDAKGGWKGLGGAKPGAALARGAAAVGGHAEVNGHTAEVVVAGAKGAGIARNKDGTFRILAAGGVAGALRVTPEGAEFPSSPEDAMELFDEVLGEQARKGYAFQYRKIAGTDVFGVQGWVPGPDGRKVRRAAWVSNFQGKTRVGVGAGTGLLAAFVPRY